jgi:tripartite-type tricarboxylate transporter receptor subunit TctC
MISLTRRALCAVAVTLATFGPVKAADSYPNKPVRIIVASAPGGLVDLTARLVGQQMADKLGQPVVVENRAGGDTLLGVHAVKSAPADGYTLLATSNSVTSQPFVKLDPGYDLLKDFIGISQMVRSPWLMVVGSTQPDKTVQEFVARAKKEPATMSFASGGLGTTPFLAAESFLRQADLKLLHVPYKGNGAAMPDLIAGRVTMMFEGGSTGAPKVRAGQIRALGISSAKRLSAFPDLPTIAEQGYPDFTSYVWIGLFAPAGTPIEIVRKLNETVQSITSSDEMRQRYEADGMEAVPMSVDEFNNSLARELVEMEKLVSNLGLQKQ